MELEQHQALCISCGAIFSMRQGTPSILCRLYCLTCRPKEERKPKSPRQTSPFKIDHDYHGGYTE